MDPGLWLLFLGFVHYLGEVKSNTLSYEPNNQCRDNVTEYFVENRCCRKCRPGTRMKTECTADTDTVCEECQDRLFMDSFNYYRNCFKCTKCDTGKGLEYKKNCTKESDAVCGCKPGWFCIMDVESVCTHCKKYKLCRPGTGAKSPVMPDSDIKCDLCPGGTFSNETSSLPCKPHTRCDLQGKTVLQSGTSTSDTTCGASVTVTPTTVVTTNPMNISVSTDNVNVTTADLTTSSTSVTEHGPDASFKVPSRGPGENSFLLWLGLSGVCGLILVILIVAAILIILRNKKDALKQAGNGASKASKQNIDANSLSSPNENEILISEIKTDPSTSSSDSHSQSTIISQDCNHTEPPSISNQCVNLSFTATFQCQVNPSSGTCSIPISPCMQPVEDEFPFSEEEELCMSSQEEDGKGALPSVQESGMTVLKVSESPPTSLYCQR